MRSTDHGAEEAWTAWHSQRKRLRLECRECEVICERVVWPLHCLRSGCTSVYAYEDGETTYFGCLHRVFALELDLTAFAPHVLGARTGSDPYGPLRVARVPRPQCRISIEQAYGVRSEARSCCNPTFFTHPAVPSDDKIRLITKLRPRREPGGDE